MVTALNIETISQPSVNTFYQMMQTFECCITLMIYGKGSVERKYLADTKAKWEFS